MTIREFLEANSFDDLEQAIKACKKETKASRDSIIRMMNRVGLRNKKHTRAEDATAIPGAISEDEICEPYNFVKRIKEAVAVIESAGVLIRGDDPMRKFVNDRGDPRIRISKEDWTNSIKKSEELAPYHWALPSGQTAWGSPERLQRTKNRITKSRYVRSQS